MGEIMVNKSSINTIQRKKPLKPDGAPKQQSPQMTSSEKKDLLEIIDLHTKHLLQMDEMLSSMKDEFVDIRGLVISGKESQIDTSGNESKERSDYSWHALIDPNREYTQKEINSITKIPPSTLSTAKSRGYIPTKFRVGKRGWVVLGSDLLTWDAERAIHSVKDLIVTGEKKKAVKSKTPERKESVQKKSKPAKSKTFTIQTPVKTTKELTVQKSETKDLALPVSPKTTPTPVPSPTNTPLKSKRTVKAPAESQGTRGKKSGSKTSIETHVPIPDDIADRINTLTTKKKVNQTQFGDEVDLPQEVIYEISTRKLKKLSPERIQKMVTVLKKYESK